MVVDNFINKKQLKRNKKKKCFTVILTGFIVKNL